MRVSGVKTLTAQGDRVGGQESRFCLNRFGAHVTRQQIKIALDQEMLFRAPERRGVWPRQCWEQQGRRGLCYPSGLPGPLTLRSQRDVSTGGAHRAPEAVWPHDCLGPESESVSLLISKAGPRTSQLLLALGTSITPRPPGRRLHRERSPGHEDEPGGPRHRHNPRPSADLGTKSGRLPVMGQMGNIIDFRPSHYWLRMQTTGYTNECMWPCPNL